MVDIYNQFFWLLAIVYFNTPIGAIIPCRNGAEPITSCIVSFNFETTLQNALIVIGHTGFYNVVIYTGLQFGSRSG